MTIPNTEFARTSNTDAMVPQQRIATAPRLGRRRRFGYVFAVIAAIAGALPSGATAASHPSLDAQSLMCIKSAAKYYYREGDPLSYQGFVDLIAAVRLAEGGSVGRISRNTNGSYDIGPMQINSTHLPLLARYGITYYALLTNSCQNIFVGTWILHSEIQGNPDIWTAIGNYNSHTPFHNHVYQLRIWNNLQRVWASRVASR